MNNTFLIHQTIDFTRPPLCPPVRALLTPGDHLGHTWQVACLSGGEPAPLSGTVAGTFLRADGNAVVVAGTLNDNTVQVTLPQECYAVPGVLDSVLRLTGDDGRKVTLARQTFFVASDVTDSAFVDPGEVIPTIDDLLNRMDALTALTNEAGQMVDDYDATVRSLQRDAFGNAVDPHTLVWEIGSFAAADGKPQQNAAYVRTSAFLPVRRGSTVTVRDMEKYRFQCMWYQDADEAAYDRDNSKAAATLSKYTVPADGFLRVAIRDTEQTVLTDASVCDALVIDLAGGESVSALREAQADARFARLDDLCAGMDRMDEGALTWLADTGITEAGELVSRGGRAAVGSFIACAKGSYIRLKDRRFLLNVSAHTGLTSSSQFLYTGYGQADFVADRDCFLRVAVRRADGCDLTREEAAAALSFHIYADGEGDPAMEKGTIQTATGRDADTEAERMRTIGGVYLRKGTVVTAGADFPFYVRLYDDSACQVYSGFHSESIATSYTAPRTGWYRFITACPFVANLHLKHALTIVGDNSASARIGALEGMISPLDAFPVLHAPAAPWRYRGGEIDMALLPTDPPDWLATIYGWFDALREKYPDHVSMEVLGMDFSGEYEIRLYTIEAYPSDDHRAVLLASNIHGHERFCLTHTYWFAKTLLETHDTDEAMAFLWAHAKVMIVPAVNPWGVANKKRHNANFVDLNRNFGAGWSAGEDTDGINTWTNGEAAGSEPETRIMMKLISDHPELIFCVNRHDSGYYQAGGSVRPAYLVDAMRIDRRVMLPMTRRLEIEWRRDITWLKDVHAANATRCLFRVNPTSGNLGTMDKWWNMMGAHGCLLESSVSDIAYSAEKAQDTLRMGLEATVETLLHAVAFATLLKSSDDVEPVYELQEEA